MTLAHTAEGSLSLNEKKYIYIINILLLTNKFSDKENILLIYPKKVKQKIKTISFVNLPFVSGG